MNVAVLGPICKDRVIIDNQYSDQPGGVPYYTGSALESLGVDVTIFASCSNDDSYLLNLINAKKINHIPTTDTINFINKYADHNLDQRHQKAVYQSDLVRNNAVLSNNFSKFDYVVLGTLLQENLSEEFMKVLYSNNTKTFLTGQGLISTINNKAEVIKKIPENIQPILSSLDYLLADKQELLFLSNSDDLSSAVEILQDQGVKNFLVTDGKQGSHLFINEEIFTILAYPPTKTVDPTGAGDSYLAGFIKAQELFSDTLQQGQFAAMTATMAIEEKGPFNKSTEEVLKRLERVQ